MSSNEMVPYLSASSDCAVVSKMILPQKRYSRVLTKKSCHAAGLFEYSL